MHQTRFEKLKSYGAKATPTTPKIAWENLWKTKELLSNPRISKELKSKFNQATPRILRNSENQTAETSLEDIIRKNFERVEKIPKYSRRKKIQNIQMP